MITGATVGGRIGVTLRIYQSLDAMNDDAALLRRFAAEHLEADFAELVRRHADLVYTLALRRTAQQSEVALALTEAAFSMLAANAANLSRRAIIVGWLHATVRRLPAKQEEAVSGTGEDERGRGIDEALDHLAEDDRSALLLRYFERRPRADVGVALVLNEEAAAACVRRAVEKLCARLALQGHRIGAPAVMSFLEAQTLTPAPEAAVERIVTAAMNAAALAGVGAGRDTFRDALMGVINSGLALGTVAAIAIAAALLWGHRTNSRLQAELTRLHGDAQVLAGLQRDNRRLARLIDEVEQLRREVVDLPALRAMARANGPAPAVGTVSLTVTPAGAFQWEKEEVSAEELLQRLRTFRAQYPSADSSVLVRGAGASVSAVSYVINETRKAGIRQVLIDGDPRPDGGGKWF